MPDMKNDLLTLQEAAAELRVHTRTLTRWNKAGMIRLIPYPKGYRVERAEIERFKQRNQQMTQMILEA
jgi:excisionase family DNA binding protein